MRSRWSTLQQHGSAAVLDVSRPKIALVLACGHLLSPLLHDPQAGTSTQMGKKLVRSGRYVVVHGLARK